MKLNKKKAIRLLLIIAILLTIILLIINDYYHRIDKSTYESINYLTDHGFDFKNLKLNGEFYSYEDENYTSVIGIDVSQHQREIDFKKVKDAGVEFVFIRVGYRGYTEGKIYLDNYFEEYYKQAKDAGLKIGFYFFSQAINEKEAIEEAEFVLKNIRDKRFDLPIVYDYEDASPIGRISLLTREERTKNAIAFLERINRNNYKSMLYTSLYWMRYCYVLEDVMHYDIWYAQYYDYPQYPHPFTIWQYSELGVVDGIENNVDLNLMFIKK